MEPRPSSLEDAAYSRFAWGRYRRLMLWMTLASVLAVVAGLAFVELTAGPIPLLTMIFVGGGIFFSVLLAAALMGLVFLSSGSGHDESVGDRLGEENGR